MLTPVHPPPSLRVPYQIYITSKTLEELSIILFLFVIACMPRLQYDKVRDRLTDRYSSNAMKSYISLWT